MSSTQTKAILALACAGLIVATIVKQSPEGKPLVSEPESSSDLPPPSARDLPRHSMSYDRKSIFSKGGLDRFATYSYHEPGIDFYTREEVPSGRYSWEKSVTTPFLVEAVSCRKAEEMFVAGRDEMTGEIVIERWSYLAPTGSLASVHASYQGTLGQSRPLLATTVEVIGGTFIPPKDRNIPQPVKQTVYRGSDFSGVKSMCADPEGRFLLVQDSASFDVYQLVPGTPPVAIVESSDFPELNASFFLGPPFQLGTMERVFTLQGMPGFGADVFVFHDSDNDGNLEPPVLLTLLEFWTNYPDSIRNPANPWEHVH